LLTDIRRTYAWRQSTSQSGGVAGKAKATGKGKGHQSFEAKAVTADSVSSAFASADAEGSIASGRSGASKASGRNARSAK